MEFTRKSYEDKLEALFVRFPSVQNTGFNDAYKPGLQHMHDMDGLLGKPSARFRSIHVAGTNGKGSVSNMLASALAAKGLRVGLYTSPHIIDFRERMRIIDGRSGASRAELISEQEVWDFIVGHEKDFDDLDLSFFEITTGMAFDWFAEKEVDYAVIEAGLGGRLDSTNILVPDLSIVTSIGLDHCAMLGDTVEAIAGEKAGIFKHDVPALIGAAEPSVADVFKVKAGEVGCPLFFADESPVPSTEGLDLQGEYQGENLRTALKALDILGYPADGSVMDAIAHTAARMDFHGRWEMLHHRPDVICDIGHNPPALKKNFAQLQHIIDSGRRLLVVYGIMKDKDLSGILPLMPKDARYLMVSPGTARAMSSDELYSRCLSGIPEDRMENCGCVADGIRRALEISAADPDGFFIYIGGSTFVVSEAVTYFDEL